MKRRHPAPEMLALHARGDLPFFAGWQVRLHRMRCPECEHIATEFSSTVAELKREAATETLTAFEAIADWERLEREMLGNIAVGVAAARCIEKAGRTRGWIPTAALILALTALFIGGWMTHIPREETQRLASTLTKFVGIRPAQLAPNIVRTTPTGIAVRADGVTLTILHPPSAVVSVSGNSSVEARYVDQDTGQLTITSVYGQ